MKETPIQWCDSSVNPMMGCDGCELWQPEKGVRHCYAGALTERFAGKKGWPESFDKPALFVHKLDVALRWKDLTGTERAAKPWLSGYPRTIFLNDMGDTFTESLPVDWLSPHVPQLAASPHIWIILTKRPQRMLEWVQRSGSIPPNIWLCVSITGTATLGRLRPFYQMRDVLPRHILGLSIEPLLQDLLPAIGTHYPDVAGLVSWIKLGGESKQRDAPARPCFVDWLRGLRDYFANSASVFIKQLGSRPLERGQSLRLIDGHGGDWEEWPEDLRIRQMPRWG